MGYLNTVSQNSKMKFSAVFALTVTLFSTASAFVPSATPFAVGRDSLCLDAKHVNNKAARKANHNRPRKSRPSDINRKPTNYPTWTNPPECTFDMGSVEAKDSKVIVVTESSSADDKLAAKSAERWIISKDSK